jgi:excisionase family DNA binding protein
MDQQETASARDPNNAPRFLKTEEAASYIGTTARHMRRLVAERRIASYKIGRPVRISTADLDQWMADRRIEAQ